MFVCDRSHKRQRLRFHVSLSARLLRTWAGARNGFVGECEGYIPCELTLITPTPPIGINSGNRPPNLPRSLKRAAVLANRSSSSTCKR